MTLSRRIVVALVRRILIAQLVLLAIAAGVIAASVRWDFDDPMTGAFLAGAEIAGSIEADADGRLLIHDPEALAAFRAAHAGFWYAIRTPQGIVRDGAVPETALAILTATSPHAEGTMIWTDEVAGGPFMLETVAGFHVMVGGFRTGLADLVRYVGTIFAAHVAVILLLSTLSTLLAVATAPRLLRSLFSSLRPVLDQDWSRTQNLDTSRLPTEFQVFGDSFNRALARLSTISTKLDRAAMDIAHELKGPIASLHTRLEALPPCPQKADVLIETRAMEGLVTALLQVARDAGQAEMHSAVDLRALVRDLCLDRAPLALRGDKTIAFEVADDAPWEVATNPTLLPIAIGNLLDNAIRHTRSGDAITVRLDRRARVLVSDTGPGLPAAIKADGPSAFKRIGGRPGTGLGLVIATSIITRLGGRIMFADSETGGAAITIDLA